MNLRKFAKISMFGAWPSWLGHQTGGLGVAGSSPAAPILFYERKGGMADSGILEYERKERSF